jgi:hypothetical protein
VLLRVYEVSEVGSVVEARWKPLEGGNEQLQAESDDALEEAESR